MIETTDKKNARGGALERRDKILKAAAEIFAKKGIERTTIDEIALKAGVGKGTIYRRAGKKEQLVVLLFKEAVWLAIGRIKMNTQRKKDPLVQFKEAVNALCDVYEENLDLMKLSISQLALCIKNCKEEAEEFSSAKEDIFQLFQLIENIFKKAAKEKQIRQIDSQAITKGFFHFLDPFLYQYLRFKLNYTKSEIAQLTIDLFLNGLKAKK